MVRRIRQLVRDEEGQGLVEYGLIISVVAILVVVSLVALRGQIVTTFNKIVSALSDPESFTP